MAFLDMRTILLGYVLTDIVCLIVITMLWRHSRKRFDGMDLWVWDFALQTLALILILLRGVIPEILSILAAQCMVMIGAYLGYLALLGFSGRRAPQIHNYAMLFLLALAFVFFAYVQPDLAVRGLIISIALLIFCFQCAWFALYQASESMRRLMRWVGLVFVGYCLVNTLRVADFFFIQRIRIDFMTTVVFDKLAIISYQVLFIFLTYALVLMVNKRLLLDIAIQEEKFSGAFETSFSAMNLTRLSDGVIVECNRGFRMITGYEYDEVIGKTAKDLRLWFDDMERVRTTKDLLAGQPLSNRDCRFRKKSGEFITGLFSAEIIKLDNERYVLSSVTDITERKQMEDALQKSEYRFRNTLDHMLEGCQILDSDWRFVYVNEAAAKHGRLPQESYIGVRQTDLYPGIEKTVLFETERRCLDQGIPSRFENEFVYPDGSVGWFDLSIHPVPEGIFILSVDITERRRAQASLQQSEAFLNSIIEQSPYAIWIADSCGTLVRSNPACLKLFNVRKEEVIGKYNVFEDNLVAAQGLIPQVERAFQQGEIVRFEMSYDTSLLENVTLLEKVKLFLDATLFPIKNAEGRITNVVIQHVEISEKKRAQEEIRRLNVELEKTVEMRTRELRDTQAALLNLVDDLNESSKSLEDANRSLEEVNRELAAFSYSVSHDLRAPLRSIEGFSRALEEDFGDKIDGEGKDFLLRIRRATETMGQLIDDMLSLSRVTRTELNYQDVNLSRLTRGIVEGFNELNPSRAVDLCVQKDVIVHADEHLMNIALTNLLDNAWKFTAKVPSASIEFGCQLRDGKKEIFVRDNGAGFDSLHAGKLFSPFQRLHRANDYAGTGVGLATVQRIIHRHGGRIWAEGEVGKGAAFYFTLGTDDKRTGVSDSRTLTSEQEKPC